MGHYSLISDTESAADTTAVDNVKLNPSPQLSAVPGEALLHNALIETLRVKILGITYYIIVHEIVKYLLSWQNVSLKEYRFI